MPLIRHLNLTIVKFHCLPYLYFTNVIQRKFHRGFTPKYFSRHVYKISTFPPRNCECRYPA